MKLSETRKGEIAVLSSSLFWSLFPIFTVLSYHSLPPMSSLLGSVFFSVLFFGIILTVRRKWGEINKIWHEIFVIALFTGFGYYFLTYWGLKYTTAGNAGIIALLETFFSFLFFHVWKKEEFSWQHMVGAALMILGAAVVLIPKSSPLNRGDLFIVFAATVAPVGNYFQQKARKKVSSETIMFWRGLFALPLILLSIFIFKEHSTVTDFNNSLFLLIINGVVLFGLTKILWIEAIHRIPVTKTNALSSISPILTLILAFFILHQKPQAWQFLSVIPMIFGMILLTYQKKKPLLVIENPV